MGIVSTERGSIVVRNGGDGAGRLRVATIVAVLTFISIWPITTPTAPVPPAASGFSVDRVLGHVAEIAQAPHPMGSEEIDRVRQYVVGELEDLGLEVQMQPIMAHDYFGVPGNTVEVVNVMAKVPGGNSSGALLLVAHYDSMTTTPGANDNAVGVGVLLETARVLMEHPPFVNDIIVLFTDGEEPAPRFGSRAFVADHPWANDVGFVVNLEAAGGSGPSTVAEVSGPGRWVIEGYAKSAANPAAYSFVTAIIGLIGDLGTDFDSFRDADMPGLHFAYVRNSPIYHTVSDSIDSVHIDSVGHHATNVLGTIEAFGDTDLSAPRGADAGVYFSVGRSGLIGYGTAWALPIAMMALVLFTVGLAFGVRRSGLRLRSVVTSALVTLAGLLGGVIAVSLVWWMVTSIRSKLGVVEGYVYLISLVLFIGVVWDRVAKRRRRNASYVELLAGVTLVWLVLAVVLSAWLPGASYAFVWPTIAASVLLLVLESGRAGGSWARALVPAVVAAPALVLLTPLVDIFFQTAMPRPGNPDSQIVYVIGGSAFLIFLGVALVASAFSASVGEGGNHVGVRGRID